MDKDTFQIVFEGQLTGEYDEQQVKRNLSSLFKMNAEQIDTLFAGKGVVIKRNVDKQLAQKYAAAMKKAGAGCRIVSESAEPAAPASKQNAEPTAPAAASDATAAMTTRDVVNLKVPADLSSMSMAQAGEILLPAHDEIVPDIPDISELQLAADGGLLIPPSEIAEPDIEISGLAVKPIDD